MQKELENQLNLKGVPLNFKHAVASIDSWEKVNIHSYLNDMQNQFDIGDYD